MRIWVCRAGRGSVFFDDFIENSKIFLTWDNWKKDFNCLPSDPEELRNVIKKECGDTTSTAVSNHLSQMQIFRDRMELGDIVISPSKNSRNYSIGRIEGPYKFDPNAEEHHYHQRTVKWLNHNVSRDEFSQTLRYSLGAYRTVFEVKNGEEILKQIV